ncbi:HvfC/BufC N-terminal domain-containing protein [Phaeobacter inhibens]|uniref:HvfC/BufC N-terminal domain-containing protein n=1 Tax=Phaeobacter inhibens TaxID=221822 RepID=UPI0021A7488D|nr:DNA-binding domain-containing protein [Phaeobacter inhibens]UWR94757.1 DNA-binding domain-containing protein [Phaeobacter inhibens]
MTVSQTDFTHAMMDAGQPVPEGLLDATGQPAGRRFSVYRNNIAVSLTEAMHSAFPLIGKLLGKQNLDGLAGLYLRTHPPSSPLMMHYGAEFPAFLAGMEQLKHLGYLPDAARLDLALRRAYHAGDATAVDPARLAALAPDQLMATRLTLAPAVALLRSPWPIYDIWRFNTEENAPKPRHMAQDVLITRPEFDPIIQELPPGGADWITALTSGATLEEALTAVQANHPDFDLSHTLALLLQGGAIIDLDRKG